MVSSRRNTFFGFRSTATRSANAWNTRPASLSGATAVIGLPSSLAVRHEVRDRDAAPARRRWWQQHLIEGDRVAAGAGLAGDREAVDVGIEDADRVAPLGQGHRQVGGDARLADTTLAGRDEQRTG